ncbi:hypothetical protein BpHYR1_048746 [Brachionus plicatilis]|uniref:Uncharacterized protein n=1 Tax=Brachionus plicatilis TaxID=10195 RepID=A0A3M7Q1C3_BRAPC|nr:hypothetical protein BpHYR1_048746 [Brachionus plicatilis]
MVLLVLNYAHITKIDLDFSDLKSKESFRLVGASSVKKPINMISETLSIESSFEDQTDQTNLIFVTLFMKFHVIDNHLINL